MAEGRVPEAIEHVYHLIAASLHTLLSGIAFAAKLSMCSNGYTVAAGYAKVKTKACLTYRIPFARYLAILAAFSFHHLQMFNRRNLILIRQFRNC
jgi:hypothetical protein